MNMARNKITIRDIADKACVSKTVVSAVMNHRVGRTCFVSDRKQKQIEQLIRIHGYIPQKSARALKLQRTNTIGVIINFLTPFFSALLEELYKHASQQQFDLLQYLTGARAEKEEECLNLMRDGRVDGIVSVSFVGESAARYRKYASAPFNLRIVNITPPVEGIPGVYFDEKEVGRLAAQHLVDRGCRTFCCFGTGDRLRGTSFLAHLRKQGFTPFVASGRFSSPGFTSCFEGKESFTQESSITEGDFSGYLRAADDFLNEGRIPDGVFATNDEVAIALLTTALRRGISVPRDLKIVGCDNTDITRHSYPALTSVDLDIAGLAEAAVRKMICIIAGRPFSELHTTIEPRLVVREST